MSRGILQRWGGEWETETVDETKSIQCPTALVKLAQLGIRVVTKALLAQIVIAFSNGRAAAHAKKMSTLVQWAIVPSSPHNESTCRNAVD